MINKFRNFPFYMLFLLSILLNKILKLPTEFQKLPLNLNSCKLELSDIFLGSFFRDFIESLAGRETFSDKGYYRKNDRVNIVNLQNFSWLFALSSMKNKKARDHFLKETNENEIMTRPIWQLMHKLPMFKDCLKDNQENALYLEERIVNIPSSYRKNG